MTKARSFVGLDVHATKIVAAVLDAETGQLLDPSAILALLLGEPGADDVAEAIAHGVAVSTVNLSEVAEVLVRNDREVQPVIDRFREQVAVEPFTYADALVAAAFSQPSRRQGPFAG